MSLSDEILMAYADDELEPAQRAAVEQAMACDPDLARRVAEHKALRERLHRAYDPVLREPIPANLLAAAREPPAGSPDNVIALQPRAPRRRPAPWQWAAMAASLLVGLGIGQLTRWGGASDPLAARNGQLLARGALAEALNQQLASTQDPHSPMQVGISYLAKDGSYCRTFTWADRGGLAGLACREGRDWQVQMLMQSASGPEGEGQYRRAASALPAAIAQAAQAQMSGEPLDAQSEAAARASGWLPPHGR
ncbi:MAG TPA: hypothetical protein VMU40_07580 [Steroidobacteraceae bacterium]|nr:hypothetical protein [Steroidobacteraceae bacterium]